jgi:glycosyltransferase involved in cell wall biosynthesis
VLESLACGLPVVTTPVGDNAWFVNDDENGYIVPVDDSEGMAAAILRALGREWDRRKIGKSLGVGGWDRVAAQVLDFFHERLNAKERLR